ncbi:MAG: hypothetical protein E7479_05475 [Ruminococcaceae bacterium]|nr:hypothetical protein [Oscillospiraceae bacterium]
MKKFLSVVLVFAMLFSFSACGWKVEIVNPNEIIENDTVIISSEPEEEKDIYASEPEKTEEETETDDYYDEILEIPENPVKNDDNKALSESFEFSGPTKEISVMTAAHYDKTVNLVLPEDAVLEGEDYYLKAVFSDGSELSAGWIFVHKLEETTRYDDTLYYYRNPEKSLGYITHEKAVCGEYECVRIICHNGAAATDKESLSVPAEEKMYLYEYFFEINESEVLYISFYAKGSYNTEAMKLQEKIIANLSAEAPKSGYTIENGILSGRINPRNRSSEAGEEEICEDEVVKISMSVPESWEFLKTEAGENFGSVSFKTDWNEDYTVYLTVYKETGGVYDDYIDSHMQLKGKGENIYHEISGNFYKGSYVKINQPEFLELYREKDAVPVYGRFYQLLFGEYVAVVQVYIRTDSLENTVFDEKICDEFISSIKIG